MSVVRRRKDAVEALEHAMQGVQTYDPEQIDSWLIITPLGLPLDPDV